MIQVLIVDDHTMVRKGLLALLSSGQYDIEVIGEAGDGINAVEKVFELDPDVILMDLQLPLKNGLEAIQEIIKEKPEARILVLSSFGEEERISAAMRSGAYGYLLKDSSPDELVKSNSTVGSTAPPRGLSAGPSPVGV